MELVYYTTDLSESYTFERGTDALWDKGFWIVKCPHLLHPPYPQLRYETLRGHQCRKCNPPPGRPKRKRESEEDRDEEVEEHVAAEVVSD